MKRIITIVLSVLSYITVSAQGGWTLEQCIEYAVANNIQIQQAQLQVENQEITLQTNKMAYLPDLSAGIGQNFSFGRATGQDNVILNQSQASTSLNVGTTIPLFTGLRNLNQIRGGKLDLKAAISDLEKAKEDLALNVTAYYLQVLYTNALHGIAVEQLKLSTEQVLRTRVLVESGKLSESELYETLAQQALDQQTVTETNNSKMLARLDLCQLLNFTNLESFQVAELDATAMMPSEYHLSSTPENAYNYSLAHRPAIAAAESRVESSKKDIRIAQSAFYPQLSFNASYGTGYYHLYNYNNPSFGQQFRNNGSEVLGLSLSIPLFDRMVTINSVKRARLSTINRELELESSKQTLYKEIQSAYYNAIAAKDKYLAARETSKASRIAFELEDTKYSNGRSTAFDYNNAKTRLEKAEAEMAQAQFEYIFRCKIFDFYSGTPLSRK